MGSAIHIVPVEAADDLSSAIRLFKAYTEWLNLDLSFQDFATELDNMPGKYASPSGALFLAKDVDGHAVGCVALRSLQGREICEMKRLYVDPSTRGTGAGKLLAKAIITKARSLGYSTMRLDTLAHMKSAIALYKSLGFHEIEAYYSTPLADTTFLELDLTNVAAD